MAAAKKSCAKTGGVRFSDEPPAAGTPSHVHFDEKLHDSVVMVTPEDDGNFMVKVGFLKTQHRYEIVFTLPEVPALGKDACPAPVPSPHLRITDITPAPEGGLKVTCEYMAQQEGVLCEEVLLLSETNEDVCVKVRVHARVMGKMGRNKDLNDSEESQSLGDWVGPEEVPKDMQYSEPTEEAQSAGTADSDIAKLSRWAKSVQSVADRHQGTPMLLEGVRCKGVELEYDSEQSDWQGFD